MNSICFKSGYDFYNLLSILNKLSKEIRIDFIPERKCIELYAMDSFRTSLIFGIIFEDKNKNIEINFDVPKMYIIDLDHFKEICKVTKSKDKSFFIHFEYKLNLDKIRKNGISTITTKTLEFIDPGKSQLPVMDVKDLRSIEHDVELELMVSQFKDIYDEIGSYSEILTFKTWSIDGKNIFVIEEDGQKGNMEYRLESDIPKKYGFMGSQNDNGQKIILKEEGEVEANYSSSTFKVLRKLINLLPENMIIKLMYSHEVPFSLYVYFFELNLKLFQFIAPRVEQIEYIDDEDVFMEDEPENISNN